MLWAYAIVFLLGLFVGFFFAGYHLGKNVDGSLEVDSDTESIKLSKMVIDVDVTQLLIKQCLVLRLVNKNDVP